MRAIVRSQSVIALPLLLLTMFVSACSTDGAPAISTERGRDVECTAQAPDFPEFDGQQLDPVTIHDHAGVVTACRRVRSEDSAAMRETFGPPMPEIMTNTSLEISNADRGGTRLLVLWVVSGCAEAAGVEISEQFSGYRLAVIQEESGRCGGGSGLAAIEVGFTRPVALDEIAGSVRREVTRP